MGRTTKNANATGTTKTSGSTGSGGRSVTSNSALASLSQTAGQVGTGVQQGLETVSNAAARPPRPW